MRFSGGNNYLKYCTIYSNLAEQYCYELKLKGLSNRTTLVLSNTRELDRVPNTK